MIWLGKHSQCGVEDVSDVKDTVTPVSAINHSVVVDNRSSHIVHINASTYSVFVDTANANIDWSQSTVHQYLQNITTNSSSSYEVA